MKRETRGSGEQLSEEAACKAFGIEPERMERLRSIGRFVGRDWKMTVSLGKPGEGSHFNPETNAIQLDPLHVADPSRAHMAEFVAAHEGGHRAVTRMGEQIGLSRERTRELYEKLGFGFGFNAAEDPAENNWWSRQYEGFAPSMRKTYDEQFEKDAAVLGTPEINKMVRDLGSAPRFAHFGSELIRLWHTGELSHGIPDDVRAALLRCKEAAEEFFNDLPAPGHPPEAEVIDRARSRFSTFQDRIWPEMERLVEEDLRDERIRKMVEENKGEGLPEETKKEIEEAMKRAAEKAAGETEDAGEKDAAQKEADAEALREAAGKLEAEGDAEGADALRKKADAMDAEAVESRTAAKERAESLREGGSPRPVPLDELSEEARAALEKMFSKLPREERIRLEAESREAMEKLEDALSKALKSKLAKDAPESHGDRKDREEAEADARKDGADRVRRERDEEREIAKAVEGTKTEYDRAYADVAPLVNELADELDRLFLPNRHPRWRGGHPTGGRLTLQKAMQLEARPELHAQLWERKTIPHKRDFRFTLLIDLSGSMHGEKIRETFRAAVLTAEALSRAGLEIEVLGFQDELIEYKPYGETFSDAARARMSGMPAEVTNSGTHNQASWNDDGYCVDKAARRLAEQPSKDRFLIVLSDGEPVPSDAHQGVEWELGKIVREIGARKEVRLAGLGIGPGTEHVKKFYPNSAVVPVVRDLPRALKELFVDMIENPETY